ncbi:hypothetical protein Pmani_020234 [Petrolisthes manimaculis]|uniref:Uncharacterized protein n=1 Tax=Petrolisthes manimaculis TaxID=1843537 RepID=A0AAE1U6S7_9EUCA|nr:hypothetical protein Pmani_020234 [Petrolisthes manimaculis]
MRQAEEGSSTLPYHSCPACATIRLVKGGLKSAAGFLIPRPVPQGFPRDTRKSGNYRSISEHHVINCARTYRRMGSTRPERTRRTGFIHAGLKGAVIIPERRRIQPSSLGDSDSVSSCSMSQTSKGYTISRSSSVHSIATIASSALPSTRTHSRQSSLSSAAPPSLYPLSQSTSTYSVTSTSSSTVFPPGASKVPSAASGRTPALCPVSEGNGSQQSSCAYPLAQSVSAQGLSSAFPSSFFPLARSTSNLSRGWRDFKMNLMRDKKTSSKPGSIVPSDNYPALDSQQMEVPKGTSTWGKRIKFQERREKLRRFTTSVLPSQLKGLVQNQTTTTTSEPVSKPRDVTLQSNQHSDCQQPLHPGIKNKPHTTPKLSNTKDQQPQICSNPTDHQIRASKIQRLSDTSPEAPKVSDVNKMGGMNGQVMAAVTQTGSSSQNSVPVSSQQSPSPRSSSPPPKPPRTCGVVKGKTVKLPAVVIEDADGEVFIADNDTFRGLSSHVGSTGNMLSGRFASEGGISSLSHATTSGGEVNVMPPAKRTFLPPQKSASCSAIRKKKPQPAPRTIFPVLTTNSSKRECRGASSEDSVVSSVDSEVTLKYSSAGDVKNSGGYFEDTVISSTPLPWRKGPLYHPSIPEHSVSKDTTHTPVKTNYKRFLSADFATNQMDDSYTSHKCYLSTPVDSQNNSIGSLVSSVHDWNDIPWITTPPRTVIQSSQSMLNLSTDGDYGLVSRDLDVGYIVLSYQDTKENEVSNEFEG